MSKAKKQILDTRVQLSSNGAELVATLRQRLNLPVELSDRQIVEYALRTALDSLSKGDKHEKE